jgi:chromosome segregation ATPase
VAPGRESDGTLTYSQESLTLYSPDDPAARMTVTTSLDKKRVEILLECEEATGRVRANRIDLEREGWRALVDAHYKFQPQDDTETDPIAAALKDAEAVKNQAYKAASEARSKLFVAENKVRELEARLSRLADRAELEEKLASARAELVEKVAQVAYANAGTDIARARIAVLENELGLAGRPVPPEPKAESPKAANRQIGPPDSAATFDGDIPF